MLANSQFAGLSDLSFKSALVIYVIALAASLVFYGLLQSAKEKQRELVGAGGPPMDESAASASGETGSRAEKFAGMTTALVWLGVVIQFVSIILRGFSTGRFPFGNMYEYISMISAFTMLLAAFVITRTKVVSFWPWILAPIVALMFYGGTQLYVSAGPLNPALKSFWLPFHVSTVSIGASIGMFSGVASILYLLKRWKPDVFPLSILPSADKIDRIAYQLAVWCLPVFGLGIVLGALWAESAWGRPWGWDPKETFSLITWVMYAAYLHIRATPAWRKTAAWINIVALGTMLFNLFVINLVVSGLHSYAGV
ncbi:c-type cytochrome biogenesis protein CcsB [Corynebacterium pyruviciproducens]|uniref:c-type cytochrome biogenesis protein CcsB n=1 Tax=Corynebacterium pyruviciproducens TaxID=598660 RepID=UPI00245627BA|nr:c-type cytochrome biogenesis protein CcsB [Corynebacterium pyruviciproducens]MDH4657428.1 c-type cytochrome biogenesis protein CcsB [Corynebacterium pyruviciproducens]MDK7214562.1 c-type cytochrome biogenesis protein CcsB [Corynebacterium pyruviciproducens]